MDPPSAAAPAHAPAPIAAPTAHALAPSTAAAIAAAVVDPALDHNWQQYVAQCARMGVRDLSGLPMDSVRPYLTLNQYHRDQLSRSHNDARTVDGAEWRRAAAVIGRMHAPWPGPNSERIRRFACVCVCDHVH
jgi:hypothetical protein